jgi:hypothetical protein
MNYTEIVATLKSIGWEENVEGTQYVKYSRFKVPTATETEWEHFYVQVEDGYAYLCLHSKFAEWSKDFRNKTLGGITVGGKRGGHILLSSNMTAFKKVTGGTGNKIYEYFPLRFQRHSDLLAAVEVIAEKAKFIINGVPKDTTAIKPITSDRGTSELQDGGNSEVSGEDSDPHLDGQSLNDEAPLRTPLTPEEDERRRKKQAENGALGEQLAMQYEIARLTELGCPDPIDCVQQVSLVDVGAGFDIHSNWNGEERFIEVKTSQEGVDHFFISVNELNRLGELKERGWIYRVDLSNKENVMGCIEPIPNATAELSKAGVLEAIQFKATILR